MAKKSTPSKPKVKAAKKVATPAVAKKKLAKAAKPKAASKAKTTAKKVTKPAVAKKATAKKPTTKKTAVKKSVTKKVGVAKKGTAKATTARKKAASVSKSTPARKVSSNKKESSTRSVSSTKKVARSIATKKGTKIKSATSSAKSETTTSKPDNTGPIVRGALIKKASPVSFSLEDVEELLKNRSVKRETVEDTQPSAPAAVAATPKVEKKPVIADVPIKKRKHGAASLMDILGFNPSEKKSAIDLDPNEVPAKWKKYYKLLLELRDHVKEELDLHTSETLKHSTREDSGDLSGYAQHQADAATDSFDRDFALSLLSAEQDALYEIEEAIKRIRNGTYGHCEVTGEAIPKERLLAVPFTRFSIEGQREFEKNKRRKVERGTAFADNSDGVSLAGDDDDE